MSETKPEPDLAGMDWIDKHLNGVDLTGMTFREVEAKYGEEAAIHAGIAADPDTWDFDMSRARPAAEVLPDLVARYEREQAERRKRGPQRAPTKEHISLRLDSDLVEYFRNSGRGWQTRLNAMLRLSVFGEG
jgi:uncharacterized protein (DUF4415 family)